MNDYIHMTQYHMIKSNDIVKSCFRVRHFTFLLTILF